MSRTSASLRIALVPALALGAVAQDIVFTNPVAPATGFGTDAIIVGDVDGGGRRDVVVSTSSSTELRLMFSESPAAAGVSLGSGLGTRLASLGNVSGGPGDEFVSVDPGFAILWGDAAGTYNTLGGLGIPSASVGAVTAVGDLTGDGFPEIAVGDPASNAIHVCDVRNGVFLYTITDPRLGSLGSALATGPGGQLAAGAPTWSNTVPPTLSVGYVNIYALALGGATLTRTIVNAPAAVPQEFGRGIAFVGDVTGDGVADYAVLSPSMAAAGSFLGLVSTASPAIVAPIGYGAATPPGTGRIASLGDVDGDSLADVMIAAAGALRIFTTTAGGLATLPIAPQTGAFDGALTSGPDVFNQGFDSVLVAQNTTTTAATVRVAPVAAWRNLPNPPVCVILPPPARSILGNQFPLTVTTSSTTSLLALMVVDFAPAANIPFGGGTAYINLASSTANTIGTGGVVAGAPLTFVGITMPTSPAFLNVGLVFQAATIDAAGAIQVSNGILARIGAF